MAGGWHSVALVGVIIALASGCHARSTPLLGIGPLRRDDPTLYDDALAVARESGHAPVEADSVHGRFSVRATSDPTRRTVFIVQCSRDGFITVTPEGPRVARQGDAFMMTRALGQEWRDLVVSIERGVPEVRIDAH
jgi:hypothetical protein